MSRHFLQKPIWVWLSLCGWATLVSYPVMSMHFRHLVPFQSASKVDLMHWAQSHFDQTHNEPSKPTALAVHFLSVDCGCSEVIYRSLLLRKAGLSQDSSTFQTASPAVAEIVKIFPSSEDKSRTKTWMQSLAANGYKVALVDPEAEVDPEAALNPQAEGAQNPASVPSLLVARHDEHSDSPNILYSGGYTVKRVSDPSRVESALLIQTVVQGKEVANRPSFGCAVSSRIQKQLKPELAVQRAISQFFNGGSS